MFKKILNLQKCHCINVRKRSSIKFTKDFAFVYKLFCHTEDILVTRGDSCHLFLETAYSLYLWRNA